MAAGLPSNAIPEVHELGVYYTYTEPWLDWRHGGPDVLYQRLRWPVDGVLFDVEHGGAWHHSWGERPENKDDAVRIARGQLERAPTMVPYTGTAICRQAREATGIPCCRCGRPTSFATVWT